MIGLVKISSHIRWFAFLSWILIYFISAVISKEIQVPYDEALVVVWFPAGVSIVVFLLSPVRAWPAFLLLFSLVNWYLEPFYVASFAMSMVSAVSLLISPLLIASINKIFSTISIAIKYDHNLDCGFSRNMCY